MLFFRKLITYYIFPILVFGSLFGLDNLVKYVRPLEVSVLLLVLISVIGMLKKDRVFIIKDKIYIYYFLFILLNLFSSFWSVNKFLAFRNFLKYYLELFIFLVTFPFVFRKINLNFLFKILFVVVFLISLVFISLNLKNGNFIGMQKPILKMFTQAKMIPGLATTLMFTYLLFKPRKKIINFLFVILIFFTLITLERKSWVALFFSMVLQFIAFNSFFVKKIVNKSTLNLIFICILIIIIFSGLALNNDLIKNHLMSLISINTKDSTINDLDNSQKSSLERITMLNAGLRVFKKHPIIGIGFESSPIIYENNFNNLPTKWVHNEFLRVAVELGILGLILYLFLWIFPIKEIIYILVINKNTIKKEQMQNGIMILGLWGYCIVIEMLKAHTFFSHILLVLPLSLIILYKFQLHFKKMN